MIELKLHKPNYFFIRIDDSLLNEYALGFSLGDIFKVKGAGILTAADELLINIKLNKLKSNIDEYMRGESKIEVGELTKSKGIDLNGTYKTFSYRVFDNRHYYDSKMTERRRLELTKHESIENNFYLNFKSSIFGNEKFNHIYISKYVADTAVFTGQRQTYSAPLYIYNEQNKGQ